MKRRRAKSIPRWVGQRGGRGLVVLVFNTITTNPLSSPALPIVQRRGYIAPHCPLESSSCKPPSVASADPAGPDAPRPRAPGVLLSLDARPLALRPAWPDQLPLRRRPTTACGSSTSPSASARSSTSPTRCSTSPRPISSARRRDGPPRPSLFARRCFAAATSPRSGHRSSTLSPSS